MNAARAYRRLREFEEQKLANRLALLRAEIAKAARRIEETQEKTDRLSAAQQELTARNDERLEAIKARQAEELYQTGLNAILREKSSLTRLQHVQQQRETKRLEAQRRAEERRALEASIEAALAEQNSRAGIIKQTIKQQEAEARKARQAEEKARKEAAARQFQERLREQEAKTREAEASVGQLEQEEKELIQLLQFTRRNQEQAAKRLDEIRKATNTAIKANNQQLIRAYEASQREKFRLSKEIMNTVHKQAVKQITDKHANNANASANKRTKLPLIKINADLLRRPQAKENKNDEKTQTTTETVEAAAIV